jgi:hypothetical protein
VEGHKLPFLASALNGRHMDVERARARKGMRFTRAVPFPPGVTLYRFYDTAKAPTRERGAAGCWWFEFEHFQTIKHFALRHGYSLSYAARLFGAIAYEFSAVDALVVCRTKQLIAAWKGAGKQVDTNGKDVRDTPTWTPMQGPHEVYQLYVAGMDWPSKLSEQAFDVMRGERLERTGMR